MSCKLTVPWNKPIYTCDGSIGIYCAICGKRALFDATNEDDSAQIEIDFVSNHIHGEITTKGNHLFGIYPEEK